MSTNSVVSGTAGKIRTHHSGKYAVWMWLSWLIFVATAIASVIMISLTGALQMSAVTVLAVYIGQTVAALLVAGGFTILNGIYDATVESRNE